MAAVTVTFPGNLAQVSSVADLRAIPSTYLLNGMIYVSIDISTAFSFDPGSVAADDGTTVIKPNDLSPLQAGRWTYLMNFGGTGDVTQDQLDAALAQKASVAQLATKADTSALAAKADTAQLLNLGNPIQVSTATALTSSAINAKVEVDGSSSFTVNLPTMSGSDLDKGVKLAVMRTCTGAITVQSSTSNGAAVDGQLGGVVLIAGESATFVWRGSSIGWQRLDVVRVPVVFQMRNNAAIALTAGTPTAIPTVAGAQLMDQNLASLLFAGGYFVVPRTGNYRLEVVPYVTGSGGPGAIDIGWSEGASFSAPGSNQFQRSETQNGLRTPGPFVRTTRWNKGNKIFPFVTLQSPFTTGEVTYDSGNGIYTTVTITEV